MPKYTLLLSAILTMSVLVFIAKDGTCADGSGFNPVPVFVAGQGSSGGGVPVGTVIAWPYSSNPSDWDKWLECNGQTITQSAYPELLTPYANSHNR